MSQKTTALTGSQSSDALATLPANASQSRKANRLRHAFCDYHLALHRAEHRTAAQSGTSRAMIHSNYKGLVTKAEAEDCGH
jgi:hypothetical protein